MARYINADTIVHWQEFDDETQQITDRCGTIAEYIASYISDDCIEIYEIAERDESEANSKCNKEC